MNASLKKLGWISLAGVLPALFNIIQNTLQGKYFEPYMYVFGILISVVITVTVSYTVIFTLYWLDNTLTWEKHPVLRIIVELFSTNIVVASMMVLISYIFFRIIEMPTGHTYREVQKMYVITGVVMNFIITVVYESSYFFRRWKESMIKAEKLERENVQTQYDTLKQQINPHFLFNSLNVLSSLVYSNASKAEEFIDEFAKVYRYILDISHRAVVVLCEELELVNSYLFLQKIRFNEGLLIKITVSEEYEKRYVPTLGVQLLIENAIKHNIVSVENPLTVEVFVDNNMLIVKNNLQLREGHVLSTGRGLTNLKERYRLLGNELPMFMTIDNYYVAKIPLLEKNKLNKHFFDGSSDN